MRDAWCMKIGIKKPEVLAGGDVNDDLALLVAVSITLINPNKP